MLSASVLSELSLLLSASAAGEDTISQPYIGVNIVLLGVVDESRHPLAFPGR